MSAFYMNELLPSSRRVTTRTRGFSRGHDAAISEMRAFSRASSAPRLSSSLRASPLELKLLQELGYALELAREAGSHVPIAAERSISTWWSRAPPQRGKRRGMR
jgi:hypothetical protein